ncbi:hypothetical protein Scep_029945 [Stephania cephalantha]|uniref:Uncharacterized protein n=1 Tax=Stephania cephalantha TaxID=152367 RepID=A0AAP0HDX6_9MAGN
MCQKNNMYYNVQNIYEDNLQTCSNHGNKKCSLLVIGYVHKYSGIPIKLIESLVDVEITASQHNKCKNGSHSKTNKVKRINGSNSYSAPNQSIYAHDVGTLKTRHTKEPM